MARKLKYLLQIKQNYSFEIDYCALDRKFRLISRQKFFSDRTKNLFIIARKFSSDSRLLSDRTKNSTFFLQIALQILVKSNIWLQITNFAYAYRTKNENEKKSCQTTDFISDCPENTFHIARKIYFKSIFFIYIQFRLTYRIL